MSMLGVKGHDTYWTLARIQITHKTSRRSKACDTPKTTKPLSVIKDKETDCITKKEDFLRLDLDKPKLHVAVADLEGARVCA